MQRHYVMYYEMSYGLNVEMHKQMEIAKRLNAIIAQLLPFLSQEHQQQVVTAVERAKQVTMTELNSIIGQQQRPDLSRLMQLQAAGGGGLPPGLGGGGLPPGLGLPGGLPPGIPASSASLLASLQVPPASSASFMAAHMASRLPAPLNPHDFLRGKEEELMHKSQASALPGPSSRDSREEERNRTSISPKNSEGRSPHSLPEPKKMKKEENGPVMNGIRRSPPKENGVDIGMNDRKKSPISSPHGSSSSQSSTPAPKKSSEDGKSTTPKPATPTSDAAGGGPPLKPGLPGPPFGLGFPQPPGLPQNGLNGSEGYRSPYDAHPGLRAPPLGLPPGGKPYSLFFPC